ncbi:MAG: hypothetical protein GY808_16705 [Gammaproteobacteria bacterium]|nr:hypothetical protein [Gammaproteobacteria bacterium]
MVHQAFNIIIVHETPSADCPMINNDIEYQLAFEVDGDFLYDFQPKSYRFSMI